MIENHILETFRGLVGPNVIFTTKITKRIVIKIIRKNM